MAVAIAVADGQPRGLDSFPCQRSVQVPNGVLIFTNTPSSSRRRRREVLCRGVAISISSKFSPVFSLAGFPVTGYLFRELPTQNSRSVERRLTKRNVKLARTGSQINQGSLGQDPFFFSYHGTDNHRTVRCSFVPCPSADPISRFCV